MKGNKGWGIPGTLEWHTNYLASCLTAKEVMKYTFDVLEIPYTMTDLRAVCFEIIANHLKEKENDSQSG